MVKISPTYLRRRDEGRLLKIESNSRFRKSEDTAHVACLISPISQPNLDIHILLYLDSMCMHALSKVVLHICPIISLISGAHML
jgi:hypothetical protein